MLLPIKPYLLMNTITVIHKANRIQSKLENPNKNLCYQINKIGIKETKSQQSSVPNQMKIN